ncbi:hypothetical protein SAMN04487944_12414 [Gracilibacillus ureilyticus]|uniref:TadE-like protein n=1 Tax=Gracilibacillus ureilyticus TaxID=531814 RepID=A0A1H9VJK9_9BACI|nr:hypothetical protein [Gracilibacillus ureilyticus]SES21527.1 hypothetical protein SAMN04487944_12414 [Gracilibacillus ureilyticus]
MKSKQYISNEKGSINIEFMGLLPFILILLVVFVQILLSGYSILLAQKGAHESAKVYSITGSVTEAEDVLKEITSTSLLNYSDFEVINEGNSYFTVQFTGEHGILIGPDSWRDLIELPHYTYSRMIE